MADRTVLLYGDDMRLAHARIAHQIVENGGDPDQLALVGIHRRGAVLATRLRELRTPRRRSGATTAASY